MKKEIQKSVLNAILGYTSKENSRQSQLEAGKHVVTLAEWKPLHSRIKWNGEEKENLPNFDDPTPQLGLMFRCDDGVAWYRANMVGFIRHDELTEEEQASDKYEKVLFRETAYACTSKNGKLYRLKSKKRTADAQSIVDQIMTAFGMNGHSIGDVMDTLVGEETKIIITIEDDSYDGKAQTKITNFAEVKELVDDFGS